VGRSRRVYPREILGLINAKTAVPREDIGAIRILDNYSFVQVRDTVAEKIIEALNGVNFRGRTLAVNYAKFRKEEENGAENVSVPASAVPASAVPASANPEFAEEQAPEALSPESEPNAETD
jgi:RNA recognition motif-containing protein